MIGILGHEPGRVSDVVFQAAGGSRDHGGPRHPVLSIWTNARCRSGSTLLTCLLETAIPTSACPGGGTAWRQLTGRLLGRSTTSARRDAGVPGAGPKSEAAPTRLAAGRHYSGDIRALPAQRAGNRLGATSPYSTSDYMDTVSRGISPNATVRLTASAREDMIASGLEGPEGGASPATGSPSHPAAQPEKISRWRRTGKRPVSAPPRSSTSEQ